MKNLPWLVCKLLWNIESKKRTQNGHILPVCFPQHMKINGVLLRVRESFLTYIKHIQYDLKWVSITIDIGQSHFHFYGINIHAVILTMFAYKSIYDIKLSTFQTWPHHWFEIIASSKAYSKLHMIYNCCLYLHSNYPF